MTKFDICQSPVTLSSDAALEDWNQVIHGFLSHGTKTPQHLGAVLAAEPDFAMGYAAQGLFSLLLGRKEMWQVAVDACAKARNAEQQGHISARELAWVNALDAWLTDCPSGAIHQMETILRANPADTMSAKMSHGIRFVLGDGVGMRRSVERVLEAHDKTHAMRGYLLGCHSFTLEETGDYAAAERAGLEGLQYAADDAWGLHAVAHVYDMTAQPDAGIHLIENNIGAWDHCNNFRYHVWWHKALLHLDRGEIDTVMALYDTKIRHDKTDDYRDIANATSLLMRVELEGVDVGDRWSELADLAETRTEDGCLVFADLHYMLALSAAGREGAKADMTARFIRDARNAGEMARRVEDPGLAGMAGLNAFAEGRYGEAFTNMSAARAKMQTIGGSHAQRDVFERMTIDAGIRAGRIDETQAILAERINQRAGHQDRFALTRMQSLADARQIAVR